MSTVTIDDVARLAGVSIKTVSRVVNMEPNVKESTRKKVTEAIKTLDYRPNVSARSLASKRSYLIGLFYDSTLLESSFIVQVQAGILPLCRKQGYELIIHPVNWRDEGTTSDLANIIKHSRVDGAILTPPISDNPEILATFTNLKKPYIRLSPSPSKFKSGGVYTDHQHAAKLMTEHLLKLGHKKISFIYGPDFLPSSKQRKAGFLEAYTAAGIKMTQHTLMPGLNSFESGIQTAQKLLTLKHRPTAIFANNDEMASAILGIAHSLGISVPNELSVAGFDDSPLSRKVWPPLTTVRNPVTEMAEAAANLLLNQIHGHSNPVIDIVMAAELVIRQSTGPAPIKPCRITENIVMCVDGKS